MDGPNRPHKHPGIQASESPQISPRDLETLLPIISHNLRIPMVTIQGFCQELTMSCERLQELFDQDTLSEELRSQVNPLIGQDIPEAIRCIGAGVESVSTFTSCILRYLQHGQMEIQWENLDMNRLMMNMVSSMEYQMKKRGVLLHIEDLPDCVGDEMLVAQMFASLLDNAQKFLNQSRPGEISISGKMTNEWSVYAIADNGIGLSPEYQEYLSQVFGQIDLQQESQEGVGLGLVKRIIVGHQGKIEVDSVFGHGTQFRVYLRRRIGDPKKEHAED